MFGGFKYIIGVSYVGGINGIKLRVKIMNEKICMYCGDGEEKSPQPLLYDEENDKYYHILCKTLWGEFSNSEIPPDKKGKALDNMWGRASLIYKLKSYISSAIIIVFLSIIMLITATSVIQPIVQLISFVLLLSLFGYYLVIMILQILALKDMKKLMGNE